MNEQSGSRGEANFVWKCKNCKVRPTTEHAMSEQLLTSPQREHSANVKSAPIAYKQTSPPKPMNIIEFDCRGLEFTEFRPDVRQPLSRECHALQCLTGEQGEWLATGSESNAPFTSIELGEGEWFDYDDKQGEEVSIKDIKWEIRRA